MAGVRSKRRAVVRRATGGGKAQWLNFSNIFTVGGVVLAVASSWVLTGERVNNLRESDAKQDTRLTAVEQQLPGMKVIEVQLNGLNDKVDKLVNRVDKLLDRELDKR